MSRRAKSLKELAEEAGRCEPVCGGRFSGNRAKYREVFKIRSSTAILVPDRRANSKGWGKFDFAAEQGDFLADNRENRLENRYDTAAQGDTKATSQLFTILEKGELQDTPRPAQQVAVERA